MPLASGLRAQTLRATATSCRCVPTCARVSGLSLDTKRYPGLACKERTLIHPAIVKHKPPLQDGSEASPVMGFLGFNFNTLDQLGFYGSYHSKKGNQLIHFFFVPLIVWSVLVWLAYAGPVPHTDLPAHLRSLPEPVARAAEFNWAAVGVCIFTAYFTLLEPFGGLSWGVLLGLPLWLSATYTYQHVDKAWAWAIGAHLTGWFMQVAVGHRMIEGRRPALLDSLFQSLVMASLFAWMEGLFALGYRPKLQEQMQARVQANQTAMDRPKGSSQQPLLQGQQTVHTARQ